MPIETLEQRLPPKGLAGTKALDPARQAVINGYVSLAKGLLTVVVMIALTPFLIVHLGPAGFGIWSLLGLFISYIQLVDLGTSGAVAKFMGELSPPTQTRQINILFTSYMILIGIFACGAIGIAVLLRYRIEAGLGAMGLFGPEAKLFLIALTALYSVGLVSNGLAYVLLGLHRFDVANYVAVSVLLAQSLGTLAVLKAGLGLRGLTCLVVATSALSIGAYFIAARCLVPELHFCVRNFEFSQLKRLLRLGIQLQAYALVGVYYFYAGKAVVSLKFPLAAVAAFEVALRLPVLFRQGILFVLGPLMPAISHLDSRGDTSQVKKVLLQVLRYSVILGLPAFVGLAVFAEPIIRLWVGASFFDSILPLRILSLALGLSVFPDLIWIFLVGLGKQRFAVMFALAEVAFGSALSYVLAGRWGLPGVALGALGTAILGAAAFAIVLIQEKILARAELPVILSFKIIAIAGVVSGGALACLRQFDLNYWSFALAIIVAGAAYLIWIVKVGILEDTERAALRRFVPQYLYFLC